MESTAIPLDVREHVELAPYTTFGIEAKARWFADVTSVDGLRAALDWSRAHDVDVFVLGGGSNMLLHGDVEALVLRIQIHGVEVRSDDGRRVEVAAGAGEVWHDFVMHTLDQGWGGLENLSLIPGSVGASPMQNIGAYGVEIRDHFAWLDAVRISDGALQRFTAEIAPLGTAKACSNAKRRASGSSFGWPSIWTGKARSGWATARSSRNSNTFQRRNARTEM